MLYRVLLVDDEKRIRDGLSAYIDWKVLGYAPPFLAASVEEALSILSSEPVDVLITDIRLPDGTGLELCESIRPAHPDMPIFLLSAYGDFEYAREAIQLGVKQYFTKPTNLQALSDALAATRHTLDHRSRILEQQRNSENQQARSRQFLLSRLWRDLANGVVTEDDTLHAFFTDCGITFPHPQFSLIQICAPKPAADSAQSLLIHFLLNTGHVAYGFTSNDQTYLFANSPEQPGLKQVLELFLRETPASVPISFSDPVSSLSQIPKCMMQLVRSPNTLRTDISLPSSGSAQEDVLPQLQNELLEAIKANKRIDAIVLLDKLYQLYAGQPAAIRCDIFAQTILIIQQYTRRFGVTLSSMYGGDFSLSHTARQLSAPSQMDLWLREHVSTVFRVIQSNKSEYSQQIINTIHTYICAHYAEEITLASIAQVVHLSPYYISKLFKKTTGENFIDYLTGVRIEKAMELLSSPNVRIYEVAEQVGYKSTKHFSQVFRAYTGKTPSEYRAIFCRDCEAEV